MTKAAGEPDLPLAHPVLLVAATANVNVLHDVIIAAAAFISP
jgi:hypothetical protein